MESQQNRNFSTEESWKLPARGYSGDEELGSIGISPSIGHGKVACTDNQSMKKEDGLTRAIILTEHFQLQNGFQETRMITWSSVLELEVLVGELCAVDWFTTPSITKSEVTSLDHEAGDNSVEWTPLVVERFAALAHTFLSCMTIKLSMVSNH